MILVSAKDKTQEQISEVMGHVWKEYIGRIIGSNNQVINWFELTNPELLADSVDFPDFDSIYKYGYTVSETKKAIEKSIREVKFNKPTNLELKLNIDRLKKEFNGGSVGNLSWKALKVFTNSIGYDISDENIFQYVVHGIKHSGSAERMEEVEDYGVSKDCPYFLHPKTDFSSHIERIKANPNFIHSFHRTIYADRTKTINKIIQDLASGTCRPAKYQGVQIGITKNIN